jgi:hypothetical protein
MFGKRASNNATGNLVIVEIFGLWCPLTALENWLEVRGGVSTYRGPFLLHYLDALVYPNLSLTCLLLALSPCSI